MSYRDYEYDYHDLAEDADYIEEVENSDEYYYDDGTDEPWVGNDENENEVLDSRSWDNYYHNIADEISED